MSYKNLLRFVCAIMLIGITVLPAAAATITVSNNNDSGAGSFRQAVIDAAPGDTVNFSVTGTITLTTGEITIGKNLTISGPGASSLTISGNNNSRIFYINVSTVTVSLSGVTLTNGRSTSWGGAIENEGTLNVTNCTITSSVANGAGSGYGGGIDNYQGTVNITSCTISNNTANNNGGGVATYGGTISITESTLSGNTSDLGGGISSYGNSGGIFNVTRSTISGNHASSGAGKVGGGIHIDGGTLTATNSTISGNDAVNGGGGIVDGAASTITITQCTVTANTSTSGGGGIDLGSTTANIKNTILAGNTGGGGNNFYNSGSGALNSLGYNLSNDAVGAFTATGDQQNAAHDLAALTNNGGSTLTHALLDTSDAVDAIPEGGTAYNGAPATDQRGTARPQGTNVDVGAFELLQKPQLTTQAVSGIGSTSATGNGTITYLGSPDPTAHGMVWNTTGTPTLADSSSNEGATSSTGAFTSNMTGLSAYTTYYVRAYATNTQGTGYGNEVSFTTAGVAPTVTTQAVSGIGPTSATGNGNITSLGVPNPTAHGMVWNTTGSPTLADGVSNEGAASATGAFTSSMTGLSAFTTYYVKAYATNAAGTVYGNEVSFTTSPVSATVTTQAVTGITATSATGNGNITSLGVPNPTAHGMVWNTTGSPTLADNSSNNGAAGATGAFTSNMTGLAAYTTYYVKAYATNTAGTVYGNEVSFTTSAVAPTITTQAVTGIAATSATGNGNITSLGAPNPTAHGMVWNTTGSPTLADNSSNNGAASATGAFTSALTGLSPNTTYYVKAYATNTAGTVYGNEVSFTTSPLAPTVTTQAVTAITATSATGNGNITSLGAPNPTAHGMVWNTTGSPTLADNSSNNGAAAATGAFTSNMTGLSAYTTYYVKAYATNTAGTVYGNEVSFTTSAVAPAITTQAVTAITSTSATGNGNITSLGAPNPTAHGMVWNTTGSPTLADSSSNNGAASATGAFTSSITGLTANTTYYVKSYATNTAGTVYGNEVSFTTSALAPTVTTQAVTAITSTSATGNGNITSLGAPNPTAHGMVWNTTGSPTLADNSSNNGAASATGAFTSALTGLTANTTYYVRSYATNTAGTVYGNEVSFTTSPLAPTVTTQAVTAITSTTATGNGNVTALGAPNPTDHGVAWNTTGNPTIAGNHTSQGAVSATGAFTSNMTGLLANTTYYVRAYATNAAGTVYGGQVSFTTSAQLPTVTTQAVTSITATSGRGNGNITVLGVPRPFAHGVVWNTTGTPTVADFRTDEGSVSVTGAFISQMTGLTPYTTYYVRAYAQNTGGVAYGNEVSFTTLALLPSVTTQAATGIGLTSAVGHGTVTGLGAPNPTAHGLVWSTTGSPTLANNSTNEGPVSATGAFSSNITGLSAYTTYNVRAYATNAGGTVYGNEIAFTTAYILPVVTTQAVTNVGPTYAAGHGTITTVGIPTPTARGMVWNTTGNPTLADSSSNIGATSTTGAYTSNMTGLTPETLYYAKAYATTPAGTVYGNEVTFTTTAALPLVNTDEVSEITATTAVCGGKVTSEGGSAVKARGVCWSTSPRPTTRDSYTEDGKGGGRFISYLTGLTPDTTYYVRAYASSSVGTGYGEEKIFTTLKSINPPTVTITNPVDGAHVGGIVTIIAQAQGEEGIERVEFFVDANKIGEGTLTGEKVLMRFDCCDADIFFIDRGQKLKKIDFTGNIKPVINPDINVDAAWVGGDGFLYVFFNNVRIGQESTGYLTCRIDPRDGSYTAINGQIEDASRPFDSSRVFSLLASLQIPVEWLVQKAGAPLYAGNVAHLYAVDVVQNRVVEVAPLKLPLYVLDRIRAAASNPVPLVDGVDKNFTGSSRVLEPRCFVVLDEELFTAPGSKHKTVQDYSIDWDTSGYEQGEHTIKAVAYDFAGQTGEDSITVNISGLILTLTGTRETEKAWLISRDYGKLDISIEKEAVVTVAKYVIYKKIAGENGQFQALAEFTEAGLVNGTYNYNDQYLEEGQAVTYKVEALDANGVILSVSNEITI